MAETIFTKIINGEIPSTKIYEDEHTFAFLDIAPNAYGHVLVVPKKPYENLYELPDDMLCNLMRTAKKIAIALKKGIGAEGINIAMNNDRVAGQEIMHAHIHVIPRFTNDNFAHDRHLSYEEGQMQEIASKIISNL